MIRGYDATLTIALRHHAVMLMVFVATIAATVTLYIKTPKGYFPAGRHRPDDRRHLGRRTTYRSRPMVDLHREVTKIVGEDPAVAGVGSSVGGSHYSGSANSGNMFINLKPLSERDGAERPARHRPDAQQGRQAARRSASGCFRRRTCASAAGRAIRNISSRCGAPISTNSSKWAPRGSRTHQASCDGVTDVSTDRDHGGLQLEVTVDRPRASNLGVKMQAIDSALGNAFAQRQISTIYSARNQYRVILEIDPQFQRDPERPVAGLCPGYAAARRCRLSTVAKFQRGLAPLVGQSSGPVSGGDDLVRAAARHDIGTKAPNSIRQAVAEMHMPDTIRADFAGDARAFTDNAQRADHPDHCGAASRSISSSACCTKASRIR